MTSLDELKEYERQTERENINKEKRDLQRDYNRLIQNGELSDEQKARFLKRKYDIMRRERDLDDN